MRLTIGKKLVGGFLIIALLVVIAGIFGIVILGQVSDSTNIVAKEKTPVRYAVMKAALALSKTQSLMERFINQNTFDEVLEKQIRNQMDDFYMWIAMVQHGTVSPAFVKSPSGQRYQTEKIDTIVPKGSDNILSEVEKILKNGTEFKDHADDLISAQKQYSHFTVHSDGKTYDLDVFLNFVQRLHLEWVKSLKDAVNIETTFTGEIEPTQGVMANWLYTYVVDDQDLMSLLEKLKKQFIKLRGTAKKVNQEDQFKNKLKVLNRGLGSTARMDAYFQKMNARTAEIYFELKARKQTFLQLLNDSADLIGKEMQTLIQKADQEMDQALKSSSTMYKTGSAFLLIITVIAAVTAFLLGAFISRLITKNVWRLGEATKKVAQGDLKEKVTITSKDEIGDLANDTNRMIDDLRGIISQIRNFAGSLTTSSKNLTDISNELDHNAVKMNDLSDNAVNATGEMNTSMDSIAQTSQKSISNLNSVASAVEEMISTISEISSNTENGRNITMEAVATVSATSKRMNELGEAAEAISKVVDVIMNISEQTNLLALNATIEAARAGDAGKGFAVVASEVKELARQANEASEDIRKRTAAIQTSSKSTIEEIKTISKVIKAVSTIVDTIAASVEEQTTTTKEISKNINFVVSGVEEVTSNVSTATNVTKSVAENISIVSHASSEVESGGSQIKASANELAALANELNTIVAQFKI